MKTRCSFLLKFILLLASASVLTTARASTSIWLGGNGSWFSSNLWSGSVVPGSGADVLLDSKSSTISTVTLSGSSAIIDQLTISKGDTLVLQNSGTTQVSLTLGKNGSNGALVNLGTLQIGTTGTTGLLFLSGTVVFGGKGTVNLMGGPFTRIDGDTSSNTPSPGLNQLVNLKGVITGNGGIGGTVSSGSFNGSTYVIQSTAGNLKITNQSVIEAPTAGKMTLAPNSQGIVNAGTLRAVNGGYLAAVGTLLSGSNNFTPFNNAGGTILSTGVGNSSAAFTPVLAAENRSIVNLYGLNLTSGTVNVLKGGEALLNSAVVQNTAFLVTGASTLRIGDFDSNVSLNGVAFTGDATSSIQLIGRDLPELQNPIALNNVQIAKKTQVFLTNASVSVSGTLTNNGILTMGGPSNTMLPAMFLSSGTTVIAGKGTIQLAGGIITDAIAGQFPESQTVFVNATNTITGGGFIGGGYSHDGPDYGSGNLKIVNRGILESSTNQSLLLIPLANMIVNDPSVVGVVNSGTMRALNGGYLNPAASVSSLGVIPNIDNTGGLILASGSGTGPNLSIPASISEMFGTPPGNSSVVDLAGVNLSGGTLAATKGGLLRLNAAAVTNSAIVLSKGGSLLMGDTVPSNHLDGVTVTGDRSTGVQIEAYGGEWGNTSLNNVSFLGKTSVFLDAGTLLVSGSLGNTGLFRIGQENFDGNFTGLSLTGTVTLSGGGSIRLNQGQIDSDDPEAHAELVNKDNTISGNGSIGGNPFLGGGMGNIKITNQGIIQASGSDFLIVSPNDRGLVNQGTIRALSGGYIGLFGNLEMSNLTPFDNTGGTILAKGMGLNGGTNLLPDGTPDYRSIVDISGLSLTSGTIKTAGGVVKLNSASVTNTVFSLASGGVQIGEYGGDVALTGVTVLGKKSAGITVGSLTNGYPASASFTDLNLLGGAPVTLNNSYVTLSGSLNNTGLFRLGTPGTEDPLNPGNYLVPDAFGTLMISGTVRLTGKGKLQLSPPNPKLSGLSVGMLAPNFIYNTDYTKPGELTNVDNIISGNGTIGYGDLKITNGGIIQASSLTEYLSINTDSRGLVNSGTIRATGGGVIELAGGSMVPFDNTGGLISASGKVTVKNTELDPSDPNYKVVYPSTASLFGFSITGGTMQALKASVLRLWGDTAANTSIQISGASTLQLWENTALNGITLTMDKTSSAQIAGNSGTEVSLDSVNLQGVLKFVGDGGIGMSIKNLTLNQGTSLTLDNLHVVTSGSLSNSGYLQLGTFNPKDNSGYSSTLLIDGHQTLLGSGTIHLLNGSQIDGANPLGDEFVNVKNTVTGSGYIGGNYSSVGRIKITNQGLILAGKGDYLTVAPNALGVVNSGTISALPGGYLVLSGLSLTPFDNTGGLILAGAPSYLTIQRFNLSGGVIQASSKASVEITSAVLHDTSINLSGGGGLEVNGNNTLNNVSITGDASARVNISSYTARLNNVSLLGGVTTNLYSGDLIASGSLINTGIFTDSSGKLGLSGTFALLGSGTVRLVNASQIDGVNATGDQLINVNNTITGSGFIGGIYGNAGLIKITNRGLILAGKEDYLRVTPNALGVINSGTISALPGGTLTLSGLSPSTPFDNTGGLIQATGAQSYLNLNNFNLSGGVIQASSSPFANVAISSAVLHDTSINLSGGGQLVLYGNTTLNNVPITGNSAGFVNFYSDLADPTHLNNVSLLGGVNSGIATYANVIASGSLTNTGVLTDYGAKLALSGTVSLLGSGTVSLVGGAQIDGVNATGDEFININNTITTTGNGSIGGAYGGVGHIKITNRGLILVGKDNNLFLAPNSLGVVNSGTISALAGGLLTINGSVRNDGLFSINSTGNAIGRLQVNGDFLQSASGRISLQIGTLSFQPIVVSGGVTLDGTFSLTLANNLTLQSGQTLDVLRFGTRTGSFASFTGLTLSNGLTLVPSYTATDLILTAEPTGSGLVLAPTAFHLASTNTQQAPSINVQTVPEPGVGLLLLFGIGALGLRLRSRGSAR